MGYIKKLKSNELVGGTDKTTIYPVTSAEAVFEEVIEDGESNFKSQKFLNNNITGDRINEGTITDYNIAVGTITKGKLTPQVQTMLDEGQKKALTPKGNYNSETEYEALDLVFDPVTNSSYISLVTPNVGHPVDENAEGYEEGWWEKTLDGTAVNTAQAAIDAKVGQLETQVGTAITQAETAVDEAKQETLNAYTQAEALAQQITDWSSSEISSIPSYTDQHPLSNRASSAQIGYFECGTSSATQASNQIKAVTAGGYALPTSGGAVKIKMYAANTYTPTTNNPVKLQFNADATTLKELRYNNEAVSPNNTWDAGDVISVYYDGSVYQASNAQGGSNRKTDAYLYGDLRTLAVGQTYTKGEAVKTADKQLLKVTKDIEKISLTKEVSVGDLRVSGNNTYKALLAVSAYDGTETEGLYAIGSPAGAVITVTVDSSTIASLEETTPITVTISGIEIEVNVSSASTNLTIAADIASEFGTQDEWTLTDNEDGSLTLKSKVSKTSAPTITSDTGTTGVTVGFAEDSAYAGSTSLSQYTNGAWSLVTEANWILDTNMWDILTVDDLISLATEQNYASKLYDGFGIATDGSVTQKFFTEASTYSEGNTSLTKYTYTLIINPSTQKWINFSNQRCSYFLVEASKGDTFEIIAGENYSCYAWFDKKPTSIVKNTNPPYVSGTTCKTIPAKESAVITAPAGTAYLYITDTWRQSANDPTYYYTPAYVGGASSVHDALAGKPLSTLPSQATPAGYLLPRTSNVYVFSLSPNYRGHFVNLKEYSGKILRFKETPRAYMFLSTLPSSSASSYVYDNLLGVGTAWGDKRSVVIPEPSSDGGDVWFWYWTIYNQAETNFLKNVEIVSAYSTQLNKETIDTNNELKQEKKGIPAKQIKLARYRSDSNNAFGILHYSDIHGDIVAINELLDFMREYNTIDGKTVWDTVLETGDRPYHNFGDECYTSLLSPKALYVLGNHDISENAGDTMKKDSYEKFFGPFIDGWGVDMPTGYNTEGSATQYSMYWKKDFEIGGQKIRIIGLDSQHYQGVTESHTSRDQEDWFEETLADAKVNGFKVIVACHYKLAKYNGTNKTLWNDNEHKWNSSSTEIGGHVTSPSTGDPVAFHTVHELVTSESPSWNMYVRKQITDPATGNVIPVGTNQFGEILNSWIEGGGDFVAWICGHTHLDHIYYPDAYPKVLTIHIGSMGTRRDAATSQYYRNNGQFQKLLANLYYINGDTLRIIRIGYDMTNNLVSKKWLTLNYKTGKVISEG